MSLKIYTITTNGDDNGNVIAQPFTIEVAEVSHLSEGETSRTQIRVCTKNAAGICSNDAIPDVNNYDLQGTSLSTNAVLTSTFEVDLEAAYPGSWS